MYKAIATVLTWLALIASPPAAGAAPVVSAGFATVQVGDVFTMQISISGAQDLSAWQFDLAFDPAILQANFITEGTFMSGFGQTLFVPGVVDNGSGTISLTADSYVDFAPLPSGDGVLALIEFQALTEGISALALSNVFLDFGTAPAEVTQGEIVVSGNGDVPEPATPAMVAVAAVALGWVRRQRP